MEINTQLCIKGEKIIDGEKCFELIQGKKYTTSVPQPDNDRIMVFSTYWVSMPKKYFVLAEDE